jgi:hypothetical protein
MPSRPAPTRAVRSATSGGTRKPKGQSVAVMESDATAYEAKGLRGRVERLQRGRFRKAGQLLLCAAVVGLAHLLARSIAVDISVAITVLSMFFGLNTWPRRHH